MIADAHRLASEFQLVGAVNLGHHFPDREIPAIELAEVIGVDTETAGDGDNQLGRRFNGGVSGSKNITPGVLEAERGAGERPAPLPVQREGAVDEKSW